MDNDLFLSTKLDGTRLLCISPLAARTYREAVGTGLGGDHGYFIYEIDTSNPEAGIEVIAKAASTDAAVKLYEIIAASRVPDHRQV